MARSDHGVAVSNSGRAAGSGRRAAGGARRAGGSAGAPPADLERIRAEVGHALDRFLDRQRRTLVGIGEDLRPAVDAVAGLLAGGKRLRAAFCYWGWRAAQCPECPGIFAVAAALELLHASALVHDDVMDGSDTRRGQPSIHRRFADHHVAAGWRGSPDSFGTGAAILAGDLLATWTDEAYHGSGLAAAALQRGRPVLDVMRTEVFAGQYLDLLSQAAGDGTVADALRVARYKSAKYTVERPLQLGVALAGPSRADLLASACIRYALPVGVAFQLRDDVLGVFGDPADTGKPVSDDLRLGKRTVLTALARERADPRQARLLDRHLGDPGLDEAGLAGLRAVIEDTGALAECERMISSQVSEALAALREGAVTGDAAEALAALAVTATARNG